MTNHMVINTLYCLVVGSCCWFKSASQTKGGVSLILFIYIKYGRHWFKQCLAVFICVSECVQVADYSTITLKRFYERWGRTFDSRRQWRWSSPSGWCRIVCATVLRLSCCKQKTRPSVTLGKYWQYLFMIKYVYIGKGFYTQFEGWKHVVC